MENAVYKLDEGNLNDIIVKCGKIESIGNILYHMEEGDLMFPRPMEFFHQLGSMVHDDVVKIRKTVNGILNEAEKQEMARREALKKEKEPVTTDPKTVRSSIEQLLGALDPAIRAKMLFEIATKEVEVRHE